MTSAVLSSALRKVFFVSSPDILTGQKITWQNEKHLINDFLSFFFGGRLSERENKIICHVAVVS